MKPLAITLLFCCFSSLAADDQERDRYRESIIYLETETFRSDRLNGLVLNDAELNDFLKAIAIRLDPEFAKDLEIAVVKSQRVSAWVGVSKRLFITRSLLALLGSEDQVAFIIAHEMAHLKLQHSLDSMMQKKAELEKVHRRTWNSSLRSALLLVASHSREKELTADTEAFEMILSAGYDIREAPAALYRLAELTAAALAEIKLDEMTKQEKELTTALRSHPHILDRVDAAKTFADANSDSFFEPRRDIYIQVTRHHLVAELERCRILRDGSLLRVFLTGENAQTRFGIDYYFYMTELFRLDGTDEERSQIDGILAAVLQKFPYRPNVLLAQARSAYAKNDFEKAASIFSSYLNAGDRVVSALGQLVGEQPIPSLEHLKESCPSEPDDRWVHHYSIRLSRPCGWEFTGHQDYRASVSRNGTALDEIWAYHVSYAEGFKDINEEVDRDADLLELIDIYRAKLLKVYGGDYFEIGDSGVVDVDGRRWGWFEYSWLEDDGVRFRRRQYLTPDKHGVVMLAMYAPVHRYYAEYLSELQLVLRSLETDF